MLPSSNQGVGENTGFPDVCNTPIGTGTSPITYPNTGSNAMGLPMLPNVLVSMVPGHNQTAKPTMTNGDNAGCAHSSFMMSGGNNCGAVNVLTGGAPCESLANPTQGNNYNCSTDTKLVPSIVNVLVNYCAPAWAEAERELLDQPHAGLGWTAAADDPTRVVHVRRGGLAERLGVRVGDLLRAEPVGRGGVRVDRRRGGRRWVQTVAATRGPAPVATVGDRIVVRRCSWGAPAAARAALTGLAARGVRSVELDLRGNPGGLLQSATALAGLFLPSGTEVARAGGRTYTTGEAGPAWTGGLTVRIDGGTASAAEVLAAALTDRGELVGSPSRGKTGARRLGGGPAHEVERNGAAGVLVPDEEAR